MVVFVRTSLQSVRTATTLGHFFFQYGPSVIICLYFRSRAHTIVAINFIQKGKNEAGQMMTKTSIVNLVDLAGR